MRDASIVRLVAARELRDRATNRTFVISTVLTLVAILGFIVVPSFFRDDGPRQLDLGVVGETPAAFGSSLEAAAEPRDTEVEIVPLDDRAAAEDALAAEDIDAALLDSRQILVADDIDDTVHGLLEQAVQQATFLERLEEAGVAPEDVGELITGGAPLEVVTPGGTAEQREAGMGIAFFATILLFITLQINAGTLLTGTIEEKSSRVVEVLLGTVRPWQLLAGKLIGISALALSQLVAYIAIILVANEAVGAFKLPEATGAAVVTGIVMFMVGFAFYAALYAVAGAMASSVEDAQSTAGPLGFLLAGVYMAVLIGVAPNPDSLFAKVLTFLPPSAPFAIPARVSTGMIAGWEIALGATLTLIGGVLTVRLAGRLYSAAVLAGGKLRWRDVWAAEPIG